MKITVVGCGYVGLVTGACLADFGHQVTCVDTDQTKVENLKKGLIPIFEQGLDHLISHNVQHNRLHFANNLYASVPESEAIFIAVGTPPDSQGHANLSYVRQVARDIAPLITHRTLVINKSTVPVGTGDEVEDIIHSTNPNADFIVVSNPEFLKEGAAIKDFTEPDRIVIGSDDPFAIAKMREIYSPIDHVHLLVVSRRTAELIKYAANAFLAMKVTFINEIADLCECVGANVKQVSEGIGLDTRIGNKFLQAGPGYGGSCFPKDTAALAKTAQDYFSPLRIVEAVIEINRRRQIQMGNKILRASGGTLKDRTVAVLGLTFKPNTDDMRDSPAINIIKFLKDQGAVVQAYDPEGMPSARLLINDVLYCDDEYTTVTGADVLVIITEWNCFKILDLSAIHALMRTPVIVDLRNIFDPAIVRDRGFTYVGVGI